MLVSVTALGARSDRTAAAARDITNYLEGAAGGDLARSGSKGDLSPAGAKGASAGSYYSDSPEQPGRWRGEGTRGRVRQSLCMDLDSLALRLSLVEPERFTEVFEQHHRVIWTYLARLAGADVADEIAGEVFAAAFAQRDRFDPERGSVRAWLYGIATNMLRSALRSEGRARRAFARAAVADRVVDNTQIVDDIDELDDQIRRVNAGLAKLSREDRELLVLAVWEQLTYAEIAEATGVAIGTVRSRLSRTRGRLRELIATSGELFTEPSESGGTLP